MVDESTEEPAADVALENFKELGFHDACRFGKVARVKALWEEDEGMDLNEIDKLGKTPLHYAAEKGNVGVVDFLLEKGADINKVGPMGLSALMYTVAKEDRKGLAKMLEFKDKIDIEVADNAGNTALLIAAIKGNLRIFESLLKAGAKTDVVNKQGSSVYHVAILGRNKLLMETLKDNGCDINALDKTLNTPSHYAATLQNTNTLKFLVSKGADMEIKNQAGMLAKDLGTKYFAKDIGDIANPAGAVGV